VRIVKEHFGNGADEPDTTRWGRRRTWAKSVIERGTARVAGLLPVVLLKRLEIFARLGQGKGWGGSSTSREVDACLSLISSEVKSNLRVVDVGANVGSWSSALLDRHRNAEVWAFEPSETASQILRQRFKGVSNLRIFRNAVSADKEEKTLYFDRPGSALSSLSKRRLDHFNIGFNGSEQISSIRLDDLCRSHDWWPHIIKLDIEGHELGALSGAETAMRRASLIQFEFGGANIDSRTFFQDFYYLLSENGFKIFRISPWRLIKIDKYSELDEVFQTTNFIAIRR